MILNAGLADLNRTIILMLAHAHCVVFHFQHAHDRHRILNSVNTHQNENRFLAFGSLISNVELENAIDRWYLVCATPTTD